MNEDIITSKLFNAVFNCNYDIFKEIMQYKNSYIYIYKINRMTGDNLLHASVRTTKNNNLIIEYLIRYFNNNGFLSNVLKEVNNNYMTPWQLALEKNISNAELINILSINFKINILNDNNKFNKNNTIFNYVIILYHKIINDKKNNKKNNKKNEMIKRLLFCNG